jgi:transcription antitermination factor NusG
LGPQGDAVASAAETIAHDGSRWSVVLTYGGCERKAVENLRRQHYDAFCPLVARPSKSDLAHLVESPLFPCYAFVGISPDQGWRSINSTYGVVRLLTDRSRVDPRPLYVDDGKIEEIMALSRSAENPLPVGTVVRVRRRGNPFCDMIGTIVGMDRVARVSVLMSMFNRDVVVEFVVSELEKL